VLVTALSGRGGLNLRVVDLTRSVQHITAQHHCSALASVALGRALVGTALLAAGREEDAVCQVTISGNGPLRSINSEVTFSADRGYVRGYVDDPSAELPLREGGLLDVSGGVGIGVLQVTRSHPSRPEVQQQGSTLLETSEIGDDLAAYLLSSEQVPSALALGVQIHEHRGSIRHAVGFLCTVLPGCSEDELSGLEANIAAVSQSGGLNQLVGGDERTTVHDVMSMLTDNLGEEFRNCCPLINKCSCSKEKFLQSFQLLGQKELQDIFEKNEGNEKVRCQWCSAEMDIAPCALKSLLLL
jgi:molecular chaperone Hsp33